MYTENKHSQLVDVCTCIIYQTHISIQYRLLVSCSFVCYYPVCHKYICIGTTTEVSSLLRLVVRVRSSVGDGVWLNQQHILSLLLCLASRRGGGCGLVSGCQLSLLRLPLLWEFQSVCNRRVVSKKNVWSIVR